MKQTGILFDLDGTLWDASEPVTQIWNQILQREPEAGGKTVTLEQISSFMGKTLQQIAAELFPEKEEEVRIRLLKTCCEEECGILQKTGARLYPGVPDTLRQLSQTYALFVVSNCQKGYIEAFLQAHGLRAYFQDWECSGRTGCTKGENIRRVVERNGLTQAFYVGDTQWDEEAARQAGLPFVYASYGFGNVPQAFWQLSDFSKLPELADKLLKEKAGSKEKEEST
ncbi:MAG: HAD family hydrolase [Acutalibacteraceae bacterium]|nr:HAD family hydrolase [Bacillota bacterium]